MAQESDGWDADIFRIVYDSVVLLPFGPAGAGELADIVQRSRLHNARAGITGVLRYDGAYFMQVLEGPRDAVMATMERIRRDLRHTDIRVLESGPVGLRDFADWHLALVTDDQVAQVRSRNPDVLEVFPYRAAEVVHSLRAMLDGNASTAGAPG